MIERGDEGGVRRRRRRRTKNVGGASSVDVGAAAVKGPCHSGLFMVFAQPISWLCKSNNVGRRALAESTGFGSTFPCIHGTMTYRLPYKGATLGQTGYVPRKQGPLVFNVGLWSFQISVSSLTVLATISSSKPCMQLSRGLLGNGISGSNCEFSK